MRIDVMAPGGGSFVGSIMPGHPPVETLGITTRNTLELRDPLTTRTARGLIEGIPYSPAWQRLPSNDAADAPLRYNVSLIKYGLNTLDERDVGMVAVFGERTGQSGFSVSGGARITFSNVTAFSCANECVLPHPVCLKVHNFHHSYTLLTTVLGIVRKLCHTSTMELCYCTKPLHT